jgi:hypothetical protein
MSPFAPTLLAGALLAGLGSAPATAQSTDVVVGVPIENGQAGRPQPGVIVDIEGNRRTTRDATPVPVIVQDGAQGGTTTVTPNFGGGYNVQNEQGKTTVRPKFGGGYTVEQNGRTTQEVTPNFGGGYKVKSAPGAPTTVVVPPSQQR